MKKSTKSSLKKRSLAISLQHKKEASHKFSKKNFCTWPKNGLELKGLIMKHFDPFSATSCDSRQSEQGQG